MLDPPNARDLLARAIAHIREEVLPAVSDRVAFNVRIALSGLELISRELAVAPDEAPREADALRRMLGVETTDLVELNALLAQRIDDDAGDLLEPARIAQLRSMAIAKLAVDQPTYATYLHHLMAGDAQAI